MTRELPVRPNLEHLKSQAKDLLDAARRNDPHALQRIRAGLPSAHAASDAALAARGLALHDAQSVIAREYGFDSWAQLRAHVERVASQSAASSAPPDAALRALLATQLNTPLPADVEHAWLAAANAPSEPIAFEASQPLLPLRNALLTAGAVVPLHVARPPTLAAVAAARAGGQQLAIVAQRRETDDTPSLVDLHEVGCSARLLHVSATELGTLWIVVRAQEWIRLEAIEQREPYLRARVSRFVVQAAEPERVAELERELRAKVLGVAREMPNAEALLSRIQAMDARELADAALGNLACSVADKAAYATETRLVARLERVLSLLQGSSV